MKTLTNKLNTLTEENKYIYLTSKELNRFVRMNKIISFSVTFGTERYTEEGGNSYFPSMDSLTLTRSQAKDMANKFAEHSTRDDKELLKKVYVSAHTSYSSDKETFFVSL
jgi:site-specific DNA-adenine methylase